VNKHLQDVFGENLSESLTHLFIGAFRKNANPPVYDRPDQHSNLELGRDLLCGSQHALPIFCANLN
jgi:hypothetical protein